MLEDRARLTALLEEQDVGQLSSCLSRAQGIAQELKADAGSGLLTSVQQQRVQELVTRVTVRPDALEIQLRLSALYQHSAAALAHSKQSGLVALPLKRRHRGNTLRLMLAADTGVNPAHAPDPTLVNLLTKAQRWFMALTADNDASATKIANAHKVSPSYVTRVIYLAFLAPELVRSIAAGEQPPELTADRLLARVPLTPNWAEQIAQLRSAVIP